MPATVRVGSVGGNLWRVQVGRPRMTEMLVMFFRLAPGCRLEMY
jgi:hypothetical protein